MSWMILRWTSGDSFFYLLDYIGHQSEKLRKKLVLRQIGDNCLHFCITENVTLVYFSDSLQI